MYRYVAILILLCLVGLVLGRARQMQRLGIRAMRFGAMDKKDFLLLPFVACYLYTVTAMVFGLPMVGGLLFVSPLIGWIGAAICCLGLGLFLWGLISFGKSFRVGLDEEHPGPLVTTGAFAISRNPIYTAFGMVIIGISLILPHLLLLLYVPLGITAFVRQLLLEEASLRKIYGADFEAYCRKVRRFL